LTAISSSARASCSVGYWQSLCRLYYRQTFHVPRFTPDRHG
jgi:hypothetical protein